MPLYLFPAQLIPVGMTLLLALLTVIPVQIPDYAAVTPNLVLISLYHWTIYRPEYLTYLPVFLIGFLLDLLTAGPLGVSSLILLLVRWLILTNRKFFIGRGFPFIWGGFTAIAALVGFATWALGGTMQGHLLEPRGFAFETVLTIAFYPVVTLGLARLQRVAMPR